MFVPAGAGFIAPSILLPAEAEDPGREIRLAKLARGAIIPAVGPFVVTGGTVAGLALETDAADPAKVVAERSEEN